MTLGEAYMMGKERLEVAGVQEFELDAFFLLEYVTGITRARFYRDYQKELDDKQVIQYQSLIAKRAKRIPLQHLTGEQEFMGLPFFVNEDVLIPRQDTETLVEAALQVMGEQARMMELPINEWGRGKQEEGRKKEDEDPEQIIYFLDMCTGSGCVLLSILKHGYEEIARANASKTEIALSQEHSMHLIKIVGLGVDVSEEALLVAKKNAERIFLTKEKGNFKDEIKARLLQSDLFEKVQGQFHLIISNPPYISPIEIEQLADEVRYHEPRIALDGGTDGLDFYRRIIQESKDYLLPDGYLLLEIGATQRKDVSDLMRYYGYKNIKTTKDLTGLDRVVQGQYNRQLSWQ